MFLKMKIWFCQFSLNNPFQYFWLHGDHVFGSDQLDSTEMAKGGKKNVCGFIYFHSLTSFNS